MCLWFEYRSHCHCRALFLSVVSRQPTRCSIYSSSFPHADPGHYVFSHQLPSWRRTFYVIFPPLSEYLLPRTIYPPFRLKIEPPFQFLQGGTHLVQKPCMIKKKHHFLSCNLQRSVAEPPLGRARAAALGASRRDLEHTFNNKDSREQEVGWIWGT